MQKGWRDHAGAAGDGREGLIADAAEAPPRLSQQTSIGACHLIAPESPEARVSLASRMDGAPGKWHDARGAALARLLRHRDRFSMLSIVFRCLGLGCLAAGASHLFLGLNADVLLGAAVPPETVRDPALDSQNRFYGTAFGLYGLLFALGAGDLKRHSVMLQCCLACFFAGGLARLVSMGLHGLPPAPVIALAASELVLPPVLFLWLRRVAGQRS